MPTVKAELNQFFFFTQPDKIKVEYVASPEMMLARYKANTSLFWAGIEFTLPITHPNFSATDEESFGPVEEDGEEPAGGGVGADGDVSTHVSYTIRMKTHTIEYTSPFVEDPERFSQASVPVHNDSFAQAQCRHLAGGDGASSNLTMFYEQQCDAGLYWSSGFLALQSAVDAALCGLEMKDGHRPVVVIQEAPRVEYTMDPSGPLRPIAVMMMIMGFAPWVQFLMVHVVGEKEHGIKEALYLMGMRLDMYWLSWFLTYAVMSTVPCFAMTILTTGMGLFANASGVLIFVVLESFSLSIIALGLLLSNFFKQAKTAGLVGMLSMTVVSLSIFAIKNIASPGWKWMLSFISPLAACFALQTALEIDATTGLTAAEFVSSGDGFSPLDATFMLFLDAALYFGLTLLWDMVVLPSEGGVYGWCCGGSGDGDSVSVLDRGAEPTCEKVSAELAETKALSVVDVHKTFGTGPQAKRALKGVSFDLYEGQIFALLGHNGAGKSTMHTIISGHSNPTRGTVKIYGHDVQTAEGRNSVRAIMGVCPQHDILFDKLTVREHLQLFGAIKGVQPAALAVAIEQGMKEVHLHTQSGVQSERLSGGQKRKLSVALALVGDPKVICLDEPTSGMDPLSRRQLWNLLQAKRAGRVMLFTTHQMDEADILADRKAVLNHGRVQCIGSSLFLKSRFGLGYHLNIVKSRTAPQAALSAVVQRHFTGTPIGCQEVGVAQGDTSECTYELPLSGLEQFAPLFTVLDAEAVTLGIASYGVSMTTLDEVFVRLADQQEEDDDNSSSKADVEMVRAGESTTDSDDELLLEEEASINGSATPSRTSLTPARQAQLWALMVVRAKQLLRTPMALIFQIVMPCILLIIGLVVVMKPPPAAGLWDNAVAIPLQPGVSTPVSMLPYVVEDGVTANAVWIKAIGDTLAEGGVNMVDESKSSSNIEAYYTAVQTDATLKFPAGLSFGAAVDSLFQQPVTTLMYDPAAVHALPSYLTALDNAACQSYSNASGGVSSISAFSRPLPVEAEVSFDSSTFNTVLFVGMAISVIPGGFAVDLVRDRKLKNKHQLFTSGTPLSVYFVAYFVMDCLMMMIPVIVGIVLMVAMNVGPLIGPALPITFLFMVVYVPLTILASFAGSYLFTEPDTCQSQLPPAINLAGFMPYIAVGVIEAAGHPETAVTLHFILCVFDPPYTLLGAMYYIFRVNAVATAQNAAGANIKLTTSSYFSNEITETHLLPTLIIMIMQCIAFAGLLWVIEFGWKKVTNKKAAAESAENYQSLREEQAAAAEPEDDDVAAAAARVTSAEGAGALIRVVGLTKSFATKGPAGSARKEMKRAVRGLSFGIESGEVLGLLGPNGAGKTTTISILTGEQLPSTGDAYIGGHSIRTELAAAFQELGFCPQFSALFPRITVWEHLVLYATLHGYSGKAAKQRAQQYMQKMGISSFKDVRCADLSGGTQRKVSIAIALIGDPRVVLLDEPSSGIDPATRRFLWDIVREHTVGRATVLTTHSMEEADALCTKIAIMTAGGMRCIGSPQHLKNKFSTGYTLELKSGLPDTEEVDRFVKQQFPSATLLEQYDGFFKYSVLDVPALSVVFGTLEQARGPLRIEDYSFSQPSLEQIFLDFAKNQPVSD
jgi:ATP-binding cassette subfamily A (ABC1) protein 5